MPAVENVDSFLCRNHRVAVEVGSALLKLRKVFHRLQCPLRTEEALDVYTAEGWGFDSSSIFLRAYIADEVKRAVGVTVDVTVKTGHAFHPILSFGLAVGSRVELLLWKLRDQ